MKKIFYVISLSFLAFSACEEKSDPTLDTANFTAIYDNNDFAANYTPIDIKETPDGGFLILGGRKLATSNYSGTYLMKADKFGNFVSELEVDELLVNPVGPIITIADKFYVVCMDNLTTEARLLEVSADAEVVSVANIGGFTYPCAVNIEAENSLILLLGYNSVDKETIFARAETDGSLSGGISSFSIGIGEDIEEPIINHYIRTSRHLPFAVGKSGSLYYFNGFINYTFSLAFFNPAAEEPNGVVQGQQDEGGISALLPIAGNKFAAARFNFGDNFLMPSALFQISGNTSSTDLAGFNLPELVPNANIRILSVTANSKNAIVFGSDTRSKQIGLLFYDNQTGSFLTSRYLGFSNPYEIASMIQTTDGGLAVCGTTYIASRFPRICIFKISKDALAENIP